MLELVETIVKIECVTQFGRFPPFNPKKSQERVLRFLTLKITYFLPSGAATSPAATRSSLVKKSAAMIVATATIAPRMK